MTDQLKDKWPIVPLSAAVRARVVARAVAEPQLQPWPQTVLWATEQALSDWRYGLTYKLAAAAACVALGFGLGITAERPQHDVAGLAFMGTSAAAVEVSE